MSWDNPTDELRELLSDGPTDRLRYKKRCIGRTDGINNVFKTLESRRVTDFTSATGDFGVFVNSVSVSVTGDDPYVGSFALGSIPAVNSNIEATYYSQWFTDTELDAFILEATQWINVVGSNTSQVPPGLQPCVLYYAAQVAMHKMCIRWTENWNDVYQLQNPGVKMDEFVKTYRDLASDYKKKSEDLRKQFYTRSDQNLSPLFQTIVGRVRDPMPKR